MKYSFTNNTIDIAPIYEVGRPIADKEITKLFDINKGIEKCIEEMLQLCYNYGFDPGFLELSLFDPKDKQAEKFFTVLASSSNKVIEKYHEQMGCNIGLEQTILPNSIFYNTPFYFEESNKGKTFTPLYAPKKHNYKGKIISFNTVADSVNDQSKITHNIKSFLDRIEENCFDKNQEKELNSFLVIPLFRPAAPIDNSIKHIFRGGALMLYGYTEDNFNVERFALIIQNLLLKQIFKTSHSEIEVQLKQMAIELSLYHHFGNNLKNLLDPIKDDGFLKTNLDKFQHNTITGIQKTFDTLITNMTMVQKSYSNYLNEDTVDNQYIINSILEEINKLTLYSAGKHSDFDVSNMNYKENIIDRQALINLPPSIFFLIANQFTENSINAFRKYEIPTNKRQINIHITEDKHYLYFDFINNGPAIPENILNILGHKPVSGSLSQD